MASLSRGTARMSLPRRTWPKRLVPSAVVRRHERRCDQFPRARAGAERLVVQRADRAEVDDVARELVIDGLPTYVPICRFSPRPMPPSSWMPAIFCGEAHAARALDAARHVGGDQRAEVLVLHTRLRSLKRDTSRP